MNLVWGCLLAYLIGSVPTAYIFGWMLRNIDIRQHGSGNVGATNVFRVLGKGPGTAVLLVDIVKGVIPVVLVSRWLGLNQTHDYLLLSLAAVAGHNWTLFLNFKGGKGIATSLGALIGMAVQIASIRPVLAGTIIVWVICFLLSCYVSLASILAAVALAVLSFVIRQPNEFRVLAVILSVFVIWRHRSNIDRLRRGQEHKVPLYKK